MSQSTIGITYFDTNNDVQTLHETQGSAQRFSDLLDEFEPAVVALKTNHAPSSSGSEPGGVIPAETATLKVTKWKSGGCWFWVATPKGSLDDDEWIAVHTLRVSASKVMFPQDT